jgi:hypothetical protein
MLQLRLVDTACMWVLVVNFSMFCRPKITKQLAEYLTPFPPVIKHPIACTGKVRYLLFKE